MNNLSKEEQAYLNAYSKMLYGSLYYWKNKLVANGVRRSQEELEANPDNKSVVKYLKTYEEVKAYMEKVDEVRQSLLKKADDKK